MTTHYNYFFNAREIMRDQEAQLVDNYKDDYDSILPLFIFGSEKDSKTMKPEMEKVIEKCSKAIKLHSIYVHKKEHNKWIDDCYFLMGKADFYNRDYPTALKTFKYISRVYKDQDTRWDAMLWMVRIRHLTNEDDKAQEMLDYIDNHRSKFPDNKKWKYDAVYAQNLIYKGKYELAIHHLKDAISRTKKRKQRARFTFVLAQLYQEMNNYRKATEAYTNVIHLRPDYDLEFHARINRVKAFDIDGGDIAKVEKEMKKMLRDRKNAEYRGQIYMALAKLAFRQRHDSVGIQDLKNAAVVSASGSKTKVRAYHQLAKIYFKVPNYVMASAYYDSTKQVMKQSDPDYVKVSQKDNDLKELVKNIFVVERQDSLQKVAKMSEADRKRLIKKLIKKAKEDEQAKLAAQQNITNDYSQNGNNQNGGNNSGQWYFYNPTLIDFGFSDFKKNWGNRVLEDNWRRSDKSSVAFIANQNDTTGSDSTKTAANDKFSEAYYLKGLPTTDSAIGASNNMIINALYNEGRLYRESFNDDEHSIAAFKELLKRFDTCQYVLSSYYQLYRIYYQKNDNVNADYYKQKILKEYPFSEYAKLVKNPNYMKTNQQNKKRIDNYYDIIYDLYQKGNYDKVILRCNASDSIFPGNYISQKFDLLKTLAIGHTQPIDSFKTALEQFIKLYPNKPEKKYAQGILDRIKAGMGKKVSKNPKKQIYKSEKLENQQHFFVLIVPDKGNNINQMKNNFSNFNTANYPRSKLKMNSIIFDSQNQLIVIKSFKNQADAMDYYKAVKYNTKALKNIGQKQLQYFVISLGNFPIFYKDKKIPPYISFFGKNYLGEK